MHDNDPVEIGKIGVYGLNGELALPLESQVLVMLVAKNGERIFDSARARGVLPDVQVFRTRLDLHTFASGRALIIVIVDTRMLRRLGHDFRSRSDNAV